MSKRFFIYAEDDPDAVLLVRTALKRLNEEGLMIHCPDGDELTSCLRDHVERGEIPRFILLDVRMPKVDGFEALRRIRANRATEALPVILFTSSPLESDIRLGAALGATDYQVKPSSMEELTRRLAGLLRRFGLTL